MLERSFEAALVDFCAPTLMGLKAASLFRYPAEDPARLGRDVLGLGRELAPFGLALRVLNICPRTGAALVYLYRADRLRRLLEKPLVRAFLARMGYPACQGCAALLEHLRSRFCQGQEFPHEIGVFLGYPLEDVIGFIENRGQNYTCCGYWKSYGDPQTAQALFDRYRQCTVLCQERYRNGMNITRLIAA